MKGAATRGVSPPALGRGSAHWWRDVAPPPVADEDPGYDPGHFTTSMLRVVVVVRGGRVRDEAPEPTLDALPLRRRRRRRSGNASRVGSGASSRTRPPRTTTTTRNILVVKWPGS